VTSFDAVVVGSGLVGACCAFELALAGLRVAVVDRGELTSGTTAAGEGNILVSDKRPGPELSLALRSLQRWQELDAELSVDCEFELKGGLVVSADETAGRDLLTLAERQRGHGVLAHEVAVDQVRDLEPHLTPDLTAAVHYPQDSQVQPVLASAGLLQRARRSGAQVLARTEVTGIRCGADGRVEGLETPAGTLSTRWVVNAAGPWSPAIARLAGSDLPVRPRRGHILVTEPCPPLIRHKVYEADYVGTLVSDADDVQCSPVVEGTRSGTILIGSSREFVGFDRTVDLDVVRELARRAVRLFPRLATVDLMRVYVGFRPWTPDHLPIIGEDPLVPGLVHATGHEGAGIGLAPATGELVRALVTGDTPPVDPSAFRADRPSLQPEVAHG
jgi:D-hydroxyproline dehydrogenase subunit beta